MTWQINGRWEWKILNDEFDAPAAILFRRRDGSSKTQSAAFDDDRISLDWATLPNEVFFETHGTVNVQISGFLKGLRHGAGIAERTGKGHTAAQSIIREHATLGLLNERRMRA